MINHLSACIFIAVLLVGCNQQQSNKNNGGETPKQDSLENHYFNYKHTVIKKRFTDTLYMYFSSDTVKDCFTFYVPAGNINHTKSILRITTQAGEVIFEDIFTTDNMVSGYATYDIYDDAKMEQYVLSEAKNMLAPDAFKYLNKLEDDNMISQSPEDIKDMDTYNECLQENRPLFYYRLFEENYSFIGYSRTKQQVKELFTCC